MACVGAPNFAAATKAIPALKSLKRWNGNVQCKKKLSFSPTMNMQQQKDQMIEQSKASSPCDNKGLLQNHELYEYVLETSVYPREQKFLKEIRDITANHAEFFMEATPDSGQLIAMLLNLINAKKTIEIGVFTGYSLLVTALTIPDDGKVLAIDPDRHSYEMGLPVIKKAGVEHKIDFNGSTALPVLDKLLEDNKNKDCFDFAFVDADKTNYANYHERLMQLVKVGGLIVYDNTLWYGTLVMPEESVDELMRPERNYLLEFNRSLAADNRIQISQVTVGDGMTICRRLF